MLVRPGPGGVEMVEQPSMEGLERAVIAKARAFRDEPVEEGKSQARM